MNLNEQIEVFKAQAKEYVEAKEDLVLAKTDFSISILGALMQKIFDGIEEILEANQKDSKKDNFDKTLGPTIKQSIETVMIEFAKQKAPQIDFKPNINIDLSSVRAIAEDIGKKNDSILALINKMQSNGSPRNDELMNLVATMIGKQNVFFDRTFKQMDYTENFKQIVEVLGRKEEKIDKLVAVRGHNNILDEVRVVYK